MIYTKKQLRLMRMWQRNELKRINLLEGSVSSGKTWISLVLWAFWVKTMPDDEDRLYLMSARSLTTLKRNCLLLLQSLVGLDNFTFSLAAKEGRLFGRRILLEGANDAQAETKIRGVTLQGAYCDELTKLPQDFFTMLLSRLRLTNAKLIATTNPDAPNHWLKTNYIDRKEDLDFLDITFTLDDNTTLPKEYVDNIKKEYVGVFYERFILGKWTLAEGLVYPNFEMALTDALPEVAVQEYAMSIDYGTQNAFAALLWAKAGDVWYVIDEYYHSGRDTGIQKTDEEYAQDLDRFLSIYALHNRLKTIIDPSAASFIALLKKREKYKVRKADNDVLDGIRETATAMQTGKIKIIRSAAVNLVEELRGYVWDEKSTDERPIKENDHAVDATRYLVKTLHVVKPTSSYKSVMG